MANPFEEKSIPDNTSSESDTEEGKLEVKTSLSTKTQIYPGLGGNYSVDPEQRARNVGTTEPFTKVDRSSTTFKTQEPNANSSITASKSQELDIESSATASNTQEPDTDSSSTASKPQEPDIESSVTASNTQEPDVDSSSTASKPQEPDIESSVTASNTQEPDVDSSSTVSKPQEPDIESSITASKTQELDVDSGVAASKQQEPDIGININSSKTQELNVDSSITTCEMTQAPDVDDSITTSKTHEPNAANRVTASVECGHAVSDWVTTKMDPSTFDNSHSASDEPFYGSIVDTKDMVSCMIGEDAHSVDTREGIPVVGRNQSDPSEYESVVSSNYNPATTCNPDTGQTHAGLGISQPSDGGNSHLAVSVTWDPCLYLEYIGNNTHVLVISGSDQEYFAIPRIVPVEYILVGICLCMLVILRICCGRRGDIKY